MMGAVRALGGHRATRRGTLRAPWVSRPGTLFASGFVSHGGLTHGVKTLVSLVASMGLRARVFAGEKNHTGAGRLGTR